LAADAVATGAPDTDAAVIASNAGGTAAGVTVTVTVAVAPSPPAKGKGPKKTPPGHDD
jgi:hypothetical protein